MGQQIMLLSISMTILLEQQKLNIYLVLENVELVACFPLEIHTCKTINIIIKIYYWMTYLSWCCYHILYTFIEQSIRVRSIRRQAHIAIQYAVIGIIILYENANTHDAIVRRVHGTISSKCIWISSDVFLIVSSSCVCASICGFCIKSITLVLLYFFLL